MKRVLGWVAGLALLSSAALGQTIATVGMWPGSPFSYVGQAVVAGYSAFGAWLDGTGGGAVATNEPGFKRASALTGVVDGGRGIISFWLTCHEGRSYQAEPQCVGTDILTHISQLTGTGSSEAAKGINVVMDTAGATAGFGTLRFNSNSATEPFASAPQFGLVATNGFGPSDYGKPTHYLIVWDHSTNTWCGAIYKNGVNLNVGLPTGTGFNANYSNAAGFAVGSNEAFSGATGYPGSQFSGALSEVYINFAPASSPCSGSNIANYSVASFYNAGKPIDLGSGCANPTTPTPPAVCIRFGSTGVPLGVNINEGSGGTFTSDYPAGVSAAPIGPGQTTGAYLKYMNYQNPVGNSVTVDFEHYVPVAGDLIVVTVVQTVNSQATNSITLSTANGFAAFGTQSGTTSSFESMNQFYKIAAGGDSPPILSVTTSGTRRSEVIVTSFYGNVNQATPFGGVGVWTDSGPTGTTSPFACIFPTTVNGAKTPQFSGSTIVTTGFIYSNGQVTNTMTQTGSQRRYWSANYVHDGSPSFFLQDYVNSGLTAVPDATVTVGPTADDDGCFMYEINHP